MRKVKEVLTAKEFKERFRIEGGQAKDTKTNKLHFCPRDLGFDFTLEDCKTSLCSQCWAEVKDYLDFKIKSEEVEK
ncbi:hypothetical protein [Clostridium sp. D53t1_180928_C8]|uniref:hypothetical protein n=1 Tax=Clostridium sp. D53t1_180928_C8 TaxID=2787101 RepID=UPI0018AC4066|nr:hypothetical protein [Clostridium sp. D53t1_180928_C8]